MLYNVLLTMLREVGFVQMRLGSFSLVFIPARVLADTACQNAKNNSDKQNARIEHDKALLRVMNAILKDDTELFKQFMDNESFQRWMKDTVFGLTYVDKATG